MNSKTFSFCNTLRKRRAQYKSCGFHHLLLANIFTQEILLALEQVDVLSQMRNQCKPIHLYQNTEKLLTFTAAGKVMLCL